MFHFVEEKLLLIQKKGKRVEWKKKQVPRPSVYNQNVNKQINIQHIMHMVRSIHIRNMMIFLSPLSFASFWSLSSLSLSIYFGADAEQ